MYDTKNNNAKNRILSANSEKLEMFTNSAKKINQHLENVLKAKQQEIRQTSGQSVVGMQNVKSMAQISKKRPISSVNRRPQSHNMGNKARVQTAGMLRPQSSITNAQ